MHFAILIYDEPDANEPFHSHGVYKDINVHRWRFGRVMDRFT